MDDPHGSTTGKGGSGPRIRLWERGVGVRGVSWVPLTHRPLALGVVVVEPVTPRLGARRPGGARLTSSPGLETVPSPV